MSELPPSYHEAAGSSSGPPPPAGAGGYPSATQEKANVAKHHASKSNAGDKRLVIWHAPTGNSLITAADEKTPIYNIIDSRAPDEAQQNKLSQEAEQRYQTHLQSGEKLPNYAGMTRQDPLSNAAPADIEFAQSIQSARAGNTHGHMTPASIWTQTVRRGGDRNSDVIATIKRHVNPNSDVSITIHGQKGGIRRHAGFPHTKYEFTYNDVSYTWTKTHSAPGTSKLDGGSFVCKTTNGKQTLAYTTSQDDRCDGNVMFEEAAVEMGLIDVLTVTGYVLRDLDDMRENPSYLRRNDMYGYGPYGSPYGRGMGFYPTPMLMPFFF